MEPLEERTVPSQVVFSDVYDFQQAEVTVTVTQDAPGNDLHWNYHVENLTFGNAQSGIGMFVLRVSDPSGIANLTSSLGWNSYVGVLMGDPELVHWESGEFGDQILIGGAANFAFTTPPRQVVVGTGEVYDPGYAYGLSGAVAVPGVPTLNLGWTNATGNGLFATAGNWWNYDAQATSGRAPIQGDNLFFDGNLSHATLTDLHGFGLSETLADFGSLNFINGYSGTANMVSDGTPGLSTNFLTMTSGAISQAFTNTDLSVLNTFTWTGGTLNNTPSTANVNIYGGGSITLPGEENTITTGSTLNFASLGGEKLTTISGLGTLLLNGLSDDGIFVRANAKVARVAQIGAGGAATQKLEGGGKLLRLEKDAGWGYIGTGTHEDNLRVENWGGLFTLGTNAPFGGVNFGAAGRSQVTVKLTGGTANNPAYGQDVLPGPGAGIPALQLMSGCVLDVGTNQVAIFNGFVWIIGNTDLAATAQAQTATVKGTYAMVGGSLGFPEAIQIGNTTVWGRFKVDGNVIWSGGDYVPGINCAANNNNEANQWIVTGTMTVDATKTVKPKIVPQPQQLPAGQQPSGTWEVIVADGQNASLQGDNPTIPQGWQLETTSDANNVKKKWSVKK